MTRMDINHVHLTTLRKRIPFLPSAIWNTVNVSKHKSKQIENEIQMKTQREQKEIQIKTLNIECIHLLILFTYTNTSSYKEYKYIGGTAISLVTKHKFYVILTIIRSVYHARENALKENKRNSLLNHADGFKDVSSSKYL